MAAKPCFLVFLITLSLLAATPWAQKGESWANKVTKGRKETQTQLQFYFHDIVSGRTPTAVQVAQSSTTSKSPTLFGAVMIADDPLTLGPEPDSKLVGRAQGLYGSACQQDLVLIMAMNFGFVDGVYNGSSISILGRNPAMNAVREMPVVGGTGVFRMVRGFAVAQTHWMNVTTGDAIVGYNVTLVH